MKTEHQLEPHRPRTVEDIPRLKLPEFVAMLAFLSATIAFSIDAMLPALPEIGRQLTPLEPNRAQLILTAFMLGLGIGTIFAGPISDAIGRKPTIIAGFTIYILSALAALMADSLEVLLVCRLLQGMGAAGPRIVGVALIRDLYQGREMAKITSIVMMVFILFPAIAPSLGQGIIWVGGWHSVFIAFALFGLIGASWLWFRQAETLLPQNRRPLRWGPLKEAGREILNDRHVMTCTLVLTLGFGQMLGLLSSAPQIFGDTYGRSETFPLWFAAMALMSSTAMFINAKLVVKLGMRRIARTAYLGQIVSSSIFAILLFSDALPPAWEFPFFFIWAASVFWIAGVTFGNLNALALQRMGHIAGLTASFVSALSTIAAVVIAVPVGLAYNGTAGPIVIATLICSSLAWYFMGWLTD